MKILLLSFLVSINIFAASDTCEVATVRYEGSIEVYGANSMVAELGWRAFETCKLNLSDSDLSIVEDLKDKCIGKYSDENGGNEALRADCAFRLVEYFSL